MKLLGKKVTDAYWKLRLRGKVRYFCIGRNKTGTTSIAAAFKRMGYRVGRQRPAQAMVSEYINREFGPLIEFCSTAEMFQDFPFSCPDTYRYLDKAFPGAKFILSVRDSADQWYESLVRFHALRFGKGGRVPTAEDLKTAPSIWTGRPWETNRALYDSPEDDPYHKGTLIEHYNAHNQAVRDYFKNRPSDFIEINVARKTDYRRLVEFIGADSSDDGFPWENSIESVRSNITQS